MPALPYPRLRDLGRANATANSKMLRMSFTRALASGWDSEWDRICVGAGMTTSQASGNGLITTGVTANSETILRYRMQLAGDCNVRAKLTFSQRIANLNAFVELVDVIGDNLPVTVNSATSITVVFPEAVAFSAGNIGQTVAIGNIVGIAGAIPTRGTVASVSGRNVTFTVAGWPATGSGTASLFGWNTHRVLFDGATTTNAKFDSIRNGYGSGDTTLTINTSTTANVYCLTVENGVAAVSDAGANAVTWTPRGYRTENLPDQDLPLVLQIRVLNGSTAPASTSTVTVGFVGIDQWDAQVVTIGRQIGPVVSSGVSINGTPAVTVSSGTITTVSTVTTVTTAGTPAVPATPYFLNSAASTNGNLILTGTSGLQAFYATNTGAAAAYVKLYNKATAPTVGTDVPEMIIPVPAAVGGVPGVAQVIPGFNGHRFALGLGIAITGGSADNDTTAVAAGQVKVKLSRTV
jgi:hypothetical protein